MKWTCSHCQAINPSGAFKCHNCPNTCGDEEVNRKMSESKFNKCLACGGPLPPLNGVEENDFAEYCSDECGERLCADANREMGLPEDGDWGCK